MTDAAEQLNGKNDSVIVGVDGSAGAVSALRWAHGLSDVLGSVTPVIAWHLPVGFDLMTRPPTAADHAIHRGSAEVRMKNTVSAVDDDLLDRAVLVEHSPAAGLIEAAADAGAELLVVGTHGRGSVASALLGSVSARCVEQSPIPVAIIPPDWSSDAPLETIVVGVDGSDNAEAALRWAFRHAKPEMKIIAVGCYSILAYGEVGLEPPIEALESKLRQTVTDAVARVMAENEGDPDVASGPEVEVRIEPRDPRAALRAIVGEEGDLLVIGSRGVSGLAHLILGSVASALVHHPTAPTIMVPASNRPPVVHEAEKAMDEGLGGYWKAVEHLVEVLDGNDQAATLRLAAVEELDGRDKHGAKHRPGQRLRDLLHRFETEHPDLTRAINDVSHHLSGMGI